MPRENENESERRKSANLDYRNGGTNGWGIKDIIKYFGIHIHIIIKEIIHMSREIKNESERRNTKQFRL